MLFEKNSSRSQVSMSYQRQIAQLYSQLKEKDTINADLESKIATVPSLVWSSIALFKAARSLANKQIDKAPPKLE